MPHERCCDGRVLVVEQEIPESEERDAADENGSHVLVFSEKRDAVGTGRLDVTGKIAGLSVLAEYRGRAWVR